MRTERNIRRTSNFNFFVGFLISIVDLNYIRHQVCCIFLYFPPRFLEFMGFHAVKKPLPASSTQLPSRPRLRDGNLVKRCAAEMNGHDEDNGRFSPQEVTGPDEVV